MKIVYIVSTYNEFQNGCFYDRCHQPAMKLQDMGHEVKFAFLKGRIDDDLLDWAEVAVFMRWYGDLDALTLLRRFKENDTKIAYEVDDDLWTVPGVNPTQDISRRNKRQAEELIGQADMITVTTEMLKERLEENPGHDNIKVCPNAVNADRYTEPEEDNEELVIGWSGSVTHWEDLNLILPALRELQEEYDFKFYLQGICSRILAAEFYNYRLQKNLGIEKEFAEQAFKAKEILDEMDFVHHPFVPPEMHADMMKTLNFDIGLCPLTDNYFNKAKSNMKFYQYAALGATTLASDIKPYNTEMKALVKNTKEDWKAKIRELIEDEKLRQDILEEQQQFVKNNRILKVVLPQTWEKYFKELI